MKRYAVGIGETLWDIFPEGKRLGGAPANFAFHAGQFGMPSIAISALGDDDLFTPTTNALEERHLEYIMPKVPFPTGTVQVTLNGKGIPTYEIKENVAWDNIPFTNDIEKVAQNCRAVCFGTLAQRDMKSRTTIRQFLSETSEDCMRIFDINLRQHFYTKEIIQDSLHLCNVLKINDEEMAIVEHLFGYVNPSQDISSKCKMILGEYGLDILVLTCGENGSYVFTPETESFFPTPEVAVADTVGAGDSFTGAFCASLLQGNTIEEAHKKAVRASAYVCTQIGAMPELPDNIKV